MMVAPMIEGRGAAAGVKRQMKVIFNARAGTNDIPEYMPKARMKPAIPVRPERRKKNRRSDRHLHVNSADRRKHAPQTRRNHELRGREAPTAPSELRRRPARSALSKGRSRMVCSGDSRPLAHSGIWNSAPH